MECKLYSNSTCQIHQNALRKIMEKVYITKKCTQCKTSHTLKTDVFELPNNKDIEKLFSKSEVVFIEQSNFSSNPFQVLILQYPIPRGSLPFLDISVIFHPGQLKSFFNPIFIMFLFGFPYLFYLI